MRVVIFEDESRAANHLQRLLAQVAPHMQILEKIESVRDAVLYLTNQLQPDLIFSDIQLADGLSFEIYKQVDVSCPIIFTTAYDQYAIEAFKTNGIDYLLKPIEEERLQKAVEKANYFSPGLLLEKLRTLQQPATTKNYKSRFMVKVGDKIKTIPTDEIQVFFSQEKASFILTRDKRTYCVDYPLDQLEQLLNPEQFFRISRKYILNIDACTDMVAWSNSRLRLKIDGLEEPNVIVARERVADFKLWLDR